MVDTIKTNIYIYTENVKICKELEKKKCRNNRQRYVGVQGMSSCCANSNVIQKNIILCEQIKKLFIIFKRTYLFLKCDISIYALRSV